VQHSGIVPDRETQPWPTGCMTLWILPPKTDKQAAAITDPQDGPRINPEPHLRPLPLPWRARGLEAKAAHTGTPADLFKPLVAFANRPGGGVLLFGLDEDAGFKVVSMGNPRKLQEALSGLAAQMEPPLYPLSRAAYVWLQSPEIRAADGHGLLAVLQHYYQVSKGTK